MKLNSRIDAAHRSSKSCLAIVVIAGLILMITVRCAQSQQCDLNTGAGNFNSGSDGSDGNYDLSATPSGTVVKFLLSDFHGTGVSKNIFNFNKIMIPAGVTVRFSESNFHGPVYWIAQSDVTIAGKLDLSGDPGLAQSQDPAGRIPAAAGSGGYPGGLGPGGSLGPQPGGGPGGGTFQASSGGATGGQFLGTNSFLLPLIGGSGGAGDNLGGGGAGGGAILIASSSSISVMGTISVNGGNGCCTGGSGGAIRLVANSIAGNGTLTAAGDPGGDYGAGSSSAGMIRVEACSYSINGATVYSTPLVLPLPSAPSPSIGVTSINGINISENPFKFPDITINSPAPVAVMITAHQVPLGTQPTLYVWSGNGDQTLNCPAGGLQGTLAASTCTINVPFVYGASRGYVKATWAQ